MNVLWSSRARLGSGQFLVLPQHGDLKVNTVPTLRKADELQPHLAFWILKTNFSGLKWSSTCRYLLGIQPQGDSEDKAMTDVEWAQLSCVAAMEMASLEWLLTNQVQIDKESNSRIYFFVLRQDLMLTQAGSKFSMYQG